MRGYFRKSGNTKKQAFNHWNFNDFPVPTKGEQKWEQKVGTAIFYQLLPLFTSWKRYGKVVDRNRYGKPVRGESVAPDQAVSGRTGTIFFLVSSVVGVTIWGRVEWLEKNKVFQFAESQAFYIL